MELYYLKEFGSEKGLGITPLTKSKILIGRHPSCDIVLQGMDISRHHAEIIRKENGWFIQNNSASGLFVDGLTLVAGIQALLSLNSTIQLGQNPTHSYTFHCRCLSASENTDESANKNEIDDTRRQFPAQNIPLCSMRKPNARGGDIQWTPKFKGEFNSHQTNAIHEVHRDQLDVSDKASAQLQKEDLKEETCKLKDSIKVLEQEREDFKKKLQDLQLEYEREKSANAELVQKQQFNALLLDFHNQEIEERQQEIYISRTENAKLLDEINNINSAIQASQAVKNQLLCENEHMKSSFHEQISNLNQTISALECEKKSLEEVINSGSAQTSSQIIQKVTDVVDEELQCAICNEPFVKAVVLSCTHSFCEHCIARWKETKPECPTCRNEIVSETRSIVVDNFIDRLMSTLSDDLIARRRQLIQEREAQEAQRIQMRPAPESYRNRRARHRRQRMRQGGGLAGRTPNPTGLRFYLRGQLMSEANETIAAPLPYSRHQLWRNAQQQQGAFSRRDSIHP